MVFKPTYNIDVIAPEIKKQICNKVVDRLAGIAIEELEQEKQSQSANTVEITN